MTGRLIAVVGPSGAGKDALIAAARARLPWLRVARRAITRPAAAGHEDHQPLTEAAFTRCAAEGAFAFHWRAHGLGYGVPASIDEDLAAGRAVLFNGSRAALPAIRAARPGLAVVLVTARPETRAARLARRGRESAAEIAGRIASEAQTPADVDAVIENDGDLASAAAAFVAAVTRLARAPHTGAQ